MVGTDNRGNMCWDGPSQEGKGAKQHADGLPLKVHHRRLARQGTGLRPRQPGEDSADNGWEAGRDRRDRNVGNRAYEGHQ